METERLNTHKGNNWFSPENMGSKEWRAWTEKWTFCSSRGKWFFLIRNKKERASEVSYKFVTLGIGGWGSCLLIISILFLLFFLRGRWTHLIGLRLEKKWIWNSRRIQEVGNSSVETGRESQLEKYILKRVRWRII